MADSWFGSREEIYPAHRGVDLLAQIDPSALWHEVLLQLTAWTVYHEDCLGQRMCGGDSRLVGFSSACKVGDTMISQSTSSTPIGVGLDTARYGHHITFLNQDRQFTTEPFGFAESREGYEQVTVALNKLAQKHG